MTYSTPELKLVGAAQGIVLARPGLQEFVDSIDLSRNDPPF